MRLASDSVMLPDLSRAIPWRTKPCLELIEGEIVEIAPIGSPHAGAVNVFNCLFVRLAGDRAVASVQQPLIVAERSVPQPDIAVLKPRADSYSRSHPSAADVLLVVEVADTSLNFDLGTKIPLYARAGISEAWVLDVQQRSLRVFRDPGPSGYSGDLYVLGRRERERACAARTHRRRGGAFSGVS